MFLPPRTPAATTPAAATLIPKLHSRCAQDVPVLLCVAHEGVWWTLDFVDHIHHVHLFMADAVTYGDSPSRKCLDRFSGTSTLRVHG